MTRQDVLQELNLWPMWRLRKSGAAAPLRETPDLESVLPGSHEDSRSGFSPMPRAEARPTGPDATGQRVAILSMDWSELKQAVAACTACRLHEDRTQSVFGVGDEQADWLFVGEGPGAEEDRQGEPFVGQAGKLLDNMLAAIHLQRGSNVYIANTVKCRPPGNRNPEAGEMAACEPYLARQIALLQPKLIVALGKVAAQGLLGSDRTIASLRGTLHQAHGIPLVVTYHPAYLLRNLPDKARAWEDLCFAVRTMQSLQTDALAAS
ncbi:MAG: uracil-DNA glycosylase [Sulfurimicrobium sp.]|nr:uracil-DNA glycosylase [Sulfurimicrobium sp.]